MLFIPTAIQMTTLNATCAKNLTCGFMSARIPSVASAPISRVSSTAKAVFDKWTQVGRVMSASR